jgi:hypothetical protein
MSDDWFGDFVLDDTWLSNEPTTLLVEPIQSSHDSRKGRELIHKRGLPLDLTLIATSLQQACKAGKQEFIQTFMCYFILHTYGRRNIRKDAVTENNLTQSQREVYARIRSELQNPVRRDRILSFINEKVITKRLINYFVVHYSLIVREISYYLDRSQYPYRIVGDFNNPQQQEILERISQGENIVWINFHQEYKNSKNKKGRRNRHAPYRRSVSVHGADGNEYSICELNFYLWLDDVGGFDLFYLFEADIREKKAKYDEEKRSKEHKVTVIEGSSKRKKRKIVLKHTDGRNYKTHLISFPTKAPFTLTHGGDDFSSLIPDNWPSLQGDLAPRNVLDPPHSNKRVKQ